MIIRINEIVNQTLLIYSTLIIYLRVRSTIELQI